MRHRKKNKTTVRIRYDLIITAIFIMLFIVIIYSISQMKTVQGNQSYQELTDAISRSCVHAYANTGAYPESLEDVEEEYGINIDKSKYTVHYEVFASNIMPKITVIAKKER